MVIVALVPSGADAAAAVVGAGAGVGAGAEVGATGAVVGAAGAAVGGAAVGGGVGAGAQAIAIIAVNRISAKTLFIFLLLKNNMIVSVGWSNVHSG